MRIPPFWTKGTYEGQDHKGRRSTFSAFGWSFESMEKALEDARNRAMRVCEVIVSGKKPNSYDYFERPFREEIVETISRDEQQAALITRNRYGALVLNSAEVLFADVDFPPVKPRGFLDFFKLLFMPAHKELIKQVLRSETINNIRRWAQENPNRHFRLYRTFAGLRLLFTDKLYDPVSAETSQLLNELNSDELYRKLTEKQECFRARLTPKPWRCDIAKPPNSYPWDDSFQENLYRRWEDEYSRQSSNYKTCEFIEEFGPPSDDLQIHLITDIHDKITCIGSEGSLA